MTETIATKKTTENSSNPVNTKPASDWRLCIAPMMEWSDRHCRYFWRLMSKHARLYSEMVTTGALIHGDRERFLTFNPQEHPVALQLGGSNPALLAECAKMAEDWGYDEVNLNCGCPSDRVQEGKIGAILMAEPHLVADCVAAMREACNIPITVKHRIGIDEQDDYDAMHHFVTTVEAAGCDTFIVHARKAWLKGLSPKQNREVPPLRYDSVVQLKHDLPHLTIVINGGIQTLAQSKTLLNDVDGVMIGREAYNNPYLLAMADTELFDDETSHTNTPPTREDILIKYAEYCAQQIARGNRLHHMSRHILGLFSGMYGARVFRRYITEHAPHADASHHILLDALACVKKPEGVFVASTNATHS